MYSKRHIWFRPLVPHLNELQRGNLSIPLTSGRPHPTPHTPTPPLPHVPTPHTPTSPSGRVDPDGNESPERQTCLQGHRT